MADRRTRAVDAAQGVEGLDEATLVAVDRVEVAVEWIERAFGSLLDAHHEVGHAQALLVEAAGALRDAGHAALGEAVLADLASRDAAGDRWTYQIVDEFRAHLLEPARRADERVRAELTGGVRHGLEARRKRDMPGASHATEVRLPPG